MRLVEVKLTNFRGYQSETGISIEALTVLIGKNDAGKSSVLEALDVFFNEAPIEKEDCCVRSGSSTIRIACVFDDLPARLVIDNLYNTTLSSEYLLREDGRLEIAKDYNCSVAKGKLSQVVAKASHPSAAGLNDLLSLKLSELKTRAQQRQVDLDQVNVTVKAEIRRAIWSQAPALELMEQEVSLVKEGGSEVWEQLRASLPLYALFKSDRPSTDQDAEAQDPLKSAIKEAIQGRAGELTSVLEDITREVQLVADRTVEKIREMNPELANQLKPTVKNKNWDSLFSVTLTGDDDISINKRGSGTRRLVLLNFFRAKAEQLSTAKEAGVIYAIEEPETSQHPAHQIMLLDAFEDLVQQPQCQVLLTTHTPTLARRVHRNSLRLISVDGGQPRVLNGDDDNTLQQIRRTLGVLPDNDVKVFLGVEGKHDVHFLKRLARILAASEPDIPDLEQAELSGALVFVPLGGSNLEMWVTTLARLERPEFYLTDRDNPPPAQPKYHAQIAQWNARGCTAWATTKRELENYLHTSVLVAQVPDYAGTGNDFENVPSLFAEAVHSADPSAPPWASVTLEKRKLKESHAKKRINTVCVEAMTPALLSASDPNDDIRSWLRAIGVKLNEALATS